MTIEEEIAHVIDETVNHYGAGDYPATAEFVEALSPLLNRVRAEAIRDATRVFAEGGWIDTFTAGVVDDVTAVQAADRWFTAHAATIEQNSEGNET